MCFDKVLTSSAVVMTMELQRRRMNLESEKELTTDRVPFLVLSRCHPALENREVRIQC